MSAEAGKLAREADQFRKESNRGRSYEDMRSKVRKSVCAARDMNATMMWRNMGRSLEDLSFRVLVGKNKLCGIFYLRPANW